MGGGDSPLLRVGTAYADPPVLPAEAVRMEIPAQQVVDVAAFGHHHQSGGSLVQAVHRVKEEICPPGPGQGPRHGGGVRQEIGGVGRHARGLVHHQQMTVLPHHRQRPAAGDDGGPGGTVVPGLCGERVSGVENVHRAGVFSVDQDAVFHPGQTRDGVRGEVKLGPEDVTDGRSVLLRRNGVGDGFHRHVLSPASIPQAAPFDQRKTGRISPFPQPKAVMP